MTLPNRQDLTIKAFNFTAAVVTLKRPIVTASGSVNVAPLILIDMLTEEGVTGHTHRLCFHLLVGARRQGIKSCALSSSSISIL